MRDESFRLYRKLVGIIQIIVFRNKSRNLGEGLFPRPADVGLSPQKPVAEEADNKKQDQSRNGNPGSSGMFENHSEIDRTRFSTSQSVSIFRKIFQHRSCGRVARFRLLLQGAKD